MVTYFHFQSIILHQFHILQRIPLMTTVQYQSGSDATASRFQFANVDGLVNGFFGHETISGPFASWKETINEWHQRKKIKES